MKTVFRSGGAALLALLAVAGCAATDPYARAGTWQPTGANSRNIAAMAANKQDLIRGRGSPGSDPIESSSAVFRLWEGTPRALPASSSKSTGGGS